MKHFSLPKDGGLIEAECPKGILHARERIYTEILPDELKASEQIADIICKAFSEHNAKHPDVLFRLGLSTGSSPLTLYRILSQRCADGQISFRNVAVYTLDEFYSQTISEKQSKSRNSIIRENLLDKVDILPENVHLPDGKVASEIAYEYCAEYDKMTRGLDLLVMGVGEKGQIGFNESGSTAVSRTRTVILPYQSRKRQSRQFGDVHHIPNSAITMGMSTISSAKKIIIMAWSEEKAEAVFNMVECRPDSTCPASLLQGHEDITLFVDENAGSLLSRVVAPWLIGPCEWSKKFIRKAVVWLSQTVGKPILKLTLDDYLQNGLIELVELYGPYDKINIDVFNDLQHTISGWPGGKPNADDSTRPVASTPFPKTVLIFSPHPDDDVISMGGTFIRLVHQGHDVHVAYETSGNVAVHDDVVLQHMDAARQLGFGDRYDEVKALIASKKPGEAEPRELLDIKAAIRRSEARGADRSFGLNDDTNAHFLNLPFYESGGIKKLPRTQKDVDIIKELMNRLQPHMIFMAGDLADPHGTHRVCTEAALEALEQLKEEKVEWALNCQVWLYRGAWMEWELGRVDMAVPLSPDEVVEKRHSIYRHLSQKDIVPFPGDDPREFWQRAEDRTANTARMYNELGMAEYQAMEVFVKLYDKQ